MRLITLLIRWSGRDLRRRWPVVLAIALVASIGTGVFASLNSQADWRRASNDASYAAMRMHDLRLRFTAGAADADQLRRALQNMSHAGDVTAADLRLQVPTQVESADGDDVRPGLLVGLDLAAGGPRVDTVHGTAGRPLTPSDTGSVAVLEHNYARLAELPAQGEVRLAGRTPVSTVGTGLAPEHLFNGYPMAGFGIESQRAVLFMPLTSVQRIAGRPGQVNDLVLSVRPGADRALLERELGEAVRAAVPSAPFVITAREHDPTYKLMYDDIGSDQQSMLALAFLVLLGAALGAFNLTNRVVQAQRREIGVQMALGLTSAQIALRPLLFGLQVAFLGVVGGVGVGLLMNQALVNVLDEAFPLPVWRTGFQLDQFAIAAAVGLALPFAGAMIPLGRLLRTQPVDAIRTGPRHRRGGRFTSLSGHLRLPGRTLAHLPVRQVLRAPLRPLLTAIGVGTAIATIIAMFGSMDVVTAAFDKADRELSRMAPERVTVTLNSYYPSDSPQVRDVTRNRLVRSAEPGLTVPAIADPGGARLDLAITVLDLGSAMWKPSIAATTPAGAREGLVLTEKAARDLNVRPGDRITVRHPSRRDGTFAQADTRMLVAATTPYPIRGTAYLDARHAPPLGMAGLSNTVQVHPAGDTTLAELRRDLLPQPGVASVQSLAAQARDFKETMDQFTGVLQILQLIGLILVLLIAFNAASLSADERAREHATLFAFGYRPRTALASTMAEHLLIGLAGTAIGIGLGHLALRWVTGIRTEEIPDLEMTPVLSLSTSALALTLGVLLVTAAPLLTTRRLRRMDVPATLRVVE